MLASQKTHWYPYYADRLQMTYKTLTERRNNIMKTLLILRHAKTEKEAPKGDRERALTERGEKDAAFIAARVAELPGCPQSIVASGAKRARQTADIVASNIGFTTSITIEDDIYAADVDTLLEVIRRFPNTLNCVLLVGHNPGLEALGVTLTGMADPDFHLPTAGLLHIELDIEEWHGVQPGVGHIVGFYTPKS